MSNCICFDRVLPANSINARQPRRISDAKKSTGRSRLALSKGKLWPAGMSLSCGFIHGSEKQRELVTSIAKEWETYANIQLNFNSKTPPLIRIAFEENRGSWSALGTDAEYFPTDQQTVNFGWLKDETDITEFRRVVLHEFGHVLGCVHEHQNPNAHLNWNREAVYKAFAEGPNFWSKEKVDRNIFERGSDSEIEASDYDADSIMLYQFSPSLFLDGTVTKLNCELSEGDKLMISNLYPRD